MSTGDDDRGTLALAADGRLVAVGVAHVDYDRTDALVVDVALACRPLVALVRVAALIEVGQLGLDALADLDEGEVGGGLQHGAGDDVAHSLRELLEDLLTGRVAHDLGNLGLGVLRGDARGVLGRDVDLLEVVELASLVVDVPLGNELVDVDTSGRTVNGDACSEVEVQDLGVTLGQGLLEAVDEVELVDVLLLAERHQCFHHFGCHVSSFPGGANGFSRRLATSRSRV